MLDDFHDFDENGKCIDAPRVLNKISTLQKWSTFTLFGQRNTKADIGSLVGGCRMGGERDAMLQVSIGPWSEFSTLGHGSIQDFGKGEAFVMLSTKRSEDPSKMMHKTLSQCVVYFDSKKMLLPTDDQVVEPDAAILDEML